MESVRVGCATLLLVLAALSQPPPCAAKCPVHPHHPPPGEPVPTAQRTAMVWVSLVGYNATRASAALQTLRDHRRSFTHVSLVGYNIVGGKDGSFDAMHSFAAIDPSLCSQCERAVTELQTFPGVEQIPLIGDLPWGHRLEWYDALFADPEPFIQAAVLEAVKRNFSGYNLDFEPSADPGNSSWAKRYVGFIDRFDSALQEHGLKLGVDTVCLDWGTADTLNASSAQQLVSM